MIPGSGLPLLVSTVNAILIPPSEITISAGPVSDVAAGAAASVDVVVPGCTAGNSLVAICSWFDNTSAITSVTCNAESNLTVHGAPLTSAQGPTSTQWASLGLITASGDKTVTLNLNASPFKPAICVFEIAGGKTADFFDAVGGTTGSSINPTTTVTTTAERDMVVGFVYQFGGNANSAGSGYSSFETNFFPGYKDLLEYNVNIGPAGIITVDFVNAGIATWMVNAAAFKVEP